MRSFILLFLCSVSFTISAVLVNPVIVNSTLDLPAADATLSPESTSSGIITLRSAIQYSQGTESAPTTTILFDIPKSAPNNYRSETDSWRIQPTVPLGSGAAYFINRKPVIVNGYSFDGAQFNTATPNTNAFEDGTNAQLKIEIRGPGVSNTVVRGFRVTNIPGCEFRGLCINGFFGFPALGGNAIRLDGGCHNTVIAGNFFAIDITGEFADDPDTGTSLGNARSLLAINSNNLQIGGPNPADSNLASALVNDALSTFTTCNSLYQRNYCNVNRTGEKILRQQAAGSGIRLDNTGGVVGQNNQVIQNQVCGLNVGIFIQDINDEIRDNIIGTNLKGDKALGNGQGVFFVESEIRARLINNLISGNEVGVLVGGPLAALGFSTPEDVHIIECMIGTDKTGTKRLPNTSHGIWMPNAKNCVIDSCLVSANGGNGIFISEFSPGTQVLSSLIGVGTLDDNALGNGFNGVQVGVNGQDPFVHDALIGTLDELNKINANAHNGVAIVGQSIGNTVEGNIIGESGLGNKKDGVLIITASENDIFNNSLQYNNCYGIEITDNANNNEILRNIIENNRCGGVIIRSSSNNIIGADDGAECGDLENGNIINSNGGNGVKIKETNFSADCNAIMANTIVGNDERGIFLDASHGRSPNDLQDAPALTYVKHHNDHTIVKGKLEKTFPDTDFVIEFFANSTDDRDGEFFVGRFVVTTDGRGNAFFSTELNCEVEEGWYITATATELNGDIPTNTSEFSKAVKVR